MYPNTLLKDLFGNYFWKQISVLKKKMENMFDNQLKKKKFYS